MKCWIKQGTEEQEKMLKEEAIWFFFFFFKSDCPGKGIFFLFPPIEWVAGAAEEKAQKEQLIKSVVDVWDRWDWWGSSELHTVQRAGLQEQNTAVWQARAQGPLAPWGPLAD